MNDITIASRIIGAHHPPLIIAEMSGNHNQSLERALSIVDAAAAAGAHALKLQTYTADTMTLDINEGPFRIDDPGSPWRGSSLYALYQEAHTPWDWHPPIFERCAKHGLIAFSTPFDATAVEFLEGLNVPAYKVASFENIDIPLLRKLAKTKKPVLLSTGMASVEELEEAVAALRDHGCKDLILLKCTSAYPAPVEHSHIRTIPHLRAQFNVQVGLSDHTPGIGAAIAGISLGATVVEKHFTLSRADGGVDAEFSLEPDELKALVVEGERAWRSLGQVQHQPSASENASRQFRRSLYVTQDMKAGELFTADNLRSIRPGYGLPPKFLDHFIGKPVLRDVKRGSPLTWDLIEQTP